MPTALIKKLSSEYRIPVEELEQDWQLAKEKGGAKYKTEDSHYWAYTMGVFKRLLLNKYGIEVSAVSKSAEDELLEDLAYSESAVRKAAPLSSKTTGRRMKEVKTSRVKRVKEDELPNWWLKLTEHERTAYLRKHPASKFVKVFKNLSREEQRKLLKTKRPAKKVKVGEHKPVEIDEDVDELAGSTNAEAQRVVPEEADHTGKAPDPHEEADSEDDLKEPLARKTADEEEEPPAHFIDYHPTDEKLSLKQRTREYGHNAVRQAQHAYRVGRHAIKMGVLKEKHGLRSIDKMLRGHKLSDDEKVGAKRVAKHAGILLLGGLAALAMFTPLAPFAQVIGEEFFTNVKGFFTGTSESSEHDEDEDEFFSDDEDAASSKLDRAAANLSDSMYKWLISQDPQELAAKLARKYPQYATKE